LQQDFAVLTESVRSSCAGNYAAMPQPTSYEHLQEYIMNRLPSQAVGIFEEGSDDPDFAADHTDPDRLPVRPQLG
jgi:hypothetical protein